MNDKPLRRWPLFLIAAPAAVAVWSGWVGLGEMSGFGVIHPLPGLWDALRLNTAITLPVGVEAYGAYAMGAWLHPGVAPEVKSFAKRSAIGSLGLGMLGQVVYHVLNAAHIRVAPWFVIMLVACLPVVTLGFGAALSHMITRPAPPARKKPGPKPGTPRPRRKAGAEDPEDAIKAEAFASLPGWDPDATSAFPKLAADGIPITNGHSKN